MQGFYLEALEVSADFAFDKLFCVIEGGGEMCSGGPLCIVDFEHYARFAEWWLVTGSEFPTDPNNGVYIPLGDDDFEQVVLSDGKEILFYEQWYDRFYVGSNGYITFGQGDTEYMDTLENHFSMQRISALFTDLTPLHDQCISYKQLDDRMVITFEDVPLYGDKTAKNSFQLEVFFVDGTICVSWLKVAATTSVAGLSEGKGLPPVFFVESDLSAYPPCWPLGDFDRNYLLNFADFAVLAAYWQDKDCNIPYWCGRSDLDFSGATDMNDVAIFVDGWLIEEDWWLQPIGHWRFDEGEGDIAYDSAGTNHGTIYGAQWTTGQIGGALDFDGADDYVEVDDDPSLRFNQYDSFSMCLWAKPSLGGYLLSKMRASAQWDVFGYQASWSATSRFNFVIDRSWRYSTVVSTSDGSAPAGVWHHVTAVYDNTDMKIYLNGQLGGSGTFGGGTGSTTPDKNLSIGARSYDSTIEQYFNGTIDDIRIYDRALSAEEIWQLYQQGLGGRAFNPDPPDGAVNVDPNVVLSWSPGKDATSHDVYFGTDFNDVNDANTSSDAFMGNQDTNSWDANNYDSNGLDLETTHYWRIDEVGSSETCKGDVWSFTTWAEFDPNLNLIGWWKFDEGTGTTAYDSAGTNHGTIYGAQWTTGQIGGALDFDGGDGVYLETSAGEGSPLNIYNTDLTISCWARRRGTGGAIVARTKPLYHAYVLAVATDRALIDTYKIGPGHWTLYTDEILSEDTWYHIVGVFDRSAGTGYVYVDGIEEAQETLGDNPLSNDAMTKIGCRHDTGDQAFDGSIDDVRIYDRPLSAEEIWQLYQQGCRVARLL